uniref:Transmembrane channel-like protein n=1 Tax=Anas platyrhynchos platyrhynchos TaxID=8840 RepID=A0A493TR22_ANAPP
MKEPCTPPSASSSRSRASWQRRAQSWSCRRGAEVGSRSRGRMGTVCVPVYPGLQPQLGLTPLPQTEHSWHQALGTQRSIPRDGVLQGGHMPRWAPSLWALSTPSLTAHILPPSPGHPAHLAPPDTSAFAWLEPGQGEQHPGDSTTLRILASMPSRTIGECRLPSCPPPGATLARATPGWELSHLLQACPAVPAAAHPSVLLPPAGRSRGAIISQYYNRTARLRRRRSRPSLQQLSRTARPSLRQYDLESDPARATLQDKRSLLAKELLSLSPSQRSHMLLSLPLCLAEKRALWRELDEQRSPLGLRPHPTASPSPCGWCKDYITLGCRHLWYRLLALLPAAQPWHYALKQISGRFGSSVLSYFLFLKTLLMFNVFSLLILLVFVVALQAAYPPAKANQQPFAGFELLTGAGYFTHSLLYYGYYSNITLNDPSASSLSGSVAPSAPPRLPYNMPLAYLFTVGVSFFATCILLVYSMYRSFGESYRVGSSAGDLAIKVFCAWDFKVVQRRSVKLQCENICTQLKVQQEHRALAGSTWQREGILLVLPLTVSLLNTLMSHLYNLLAICERQDSPAVEVYVAICRNLLLKMLVLGLLCYHWLSRRVVCSDEECWETCVGQDLYRFMVMDFVFILLDTIFGELVFRLISEKRLKRKQRPEFDIARNVLELIYGQTLTWLGVLFAPLLPAVQVLKLLLLFYIKKTSLMQNCQAPSKPWQASRMSTVFITLLCFPSFLGAAVFISYIIWSVKPSETCGPFQGLETIYKSVNVWAKLMEKSSPNITWLTWIQQYLVENTFFLFFVSGVLLAMTYCHIQVVKGQRRIICLLKEQIANEGEDKIFLIEKLHSIYQQKEERA